MKREWVLKELCVHINSPAKNLTAKGAEKAQRTLRTRIV
jgi:hypothetical protein